MAVPYLVAVGAFFVLVLAALFGWWSADWLVARFPRPKPWSAELEPRKLLLRRICASLLVVLAVGAVGLNALGAPLTPEVQPLVAGDSWGGDDPLLLAATDNGFGGGQLTYAYRPGAQIRTGLTLANTGSAPLTVTALEPPEQTGFVRAYELLLPPPGQFEGQVMPVYPGEGPWTSEPFRPFEIPAGTEVGVGLAVDLNVCPGMTPVATLAPGVEPATDNSSRGTIGGFTAAYQIQIDYVAFGIARTATITLPDALVVSTNESPDCAGH